MEAAVALGIERGRSMLKHEAVLGSSLCRQAFRLCIWVQMNLILVVDIDHDVHVEAQTQCRVRY